MPRHWPVETRNDALSRIGRGQHYATVAREMGISPVTLRSWVKRYPEVVEAAARRHQASEEGRGAPQGGQGTSSTTDGPRGANPGDPPRGGGHVSPFAPSRGRAASLVDLDRAAYLRDRVGLLESIVRDILAADSPTYSALRPLIHLQSELHREHVEIERAEGTRLDLTADPRALAHAVEGMGRLLEILGADLDTPDTLDLTGLEDILGEIDDDLTGETP